MNWPLVKLGELVDIKGGGTPSKQVEEYWNGDIPWASVKDFKGSLITKTQDYITREGVENSATNIIPAGTLIVPTRMALGKVALTGCDMAINQDVKALLIKDKTQLSTDYLLRFLEKSSGFIEAQGQGATVKGIKLEVLRELGVPLPPLAEQKRIAAILDKADQLRQKRQQAIALADDFLRSVFLDMFGDPVTNPKGFKQLTFSEVGLLDRGKSKHRPRNDPALLGGDYPLIQTGDVAKSNGYIRSYSSTYSELGLKQSRMWPEGTLCITIAANIAKTGILTFESCFPDSVVGFTPNEKVTVEYVQFWLGFLQKTLEANAPESAQKNINLKILRELWLPVPGISLQKKFSGIVDKTTGIKSKQLFQGDLISGLFNALNQHAFLGKL